MCTYMLVGCGFLWCVELSALHKTIVAQGMQRLLVTHQPCTRTATKPVPIYRCCHRSHTHGQEGLSHLHVLVAHPEDAPDARLPGVVIVLIAWRHHHHPVAPASKGLGQRPHHVTQPSSLAPRRALSAHHDDIHHILACQRGLRGWRRLQAIVCQQVLLLFLLQLLGPGGLWWCWCWRPHELLLGHRAQHLLGKGGWWGCGRGLCHWLHALQLPVSWGLWGHECAAAAAAARGWGLHSGRLKGGLVRSRE